MVSGIFNKFLEEVIRPCATCGETKAMPRFSMRCDPCDAAETAAREPEEQARNIAEQRVRWGRQGIPKRFLGFELQEKYAEAVSRSAIIYGEVGTGKSCLGAQIMKKTRGRFISAIEMLDIIQENNNKIWDFKDMSSLCIDDFTKINLTGHRVEKLFDIFDDRYSNDRHTILATDTRPSEIKDKFPGMTGEAIVSRIGEWLLKIHLEEKFR